MRLYRRTCTLVSETNAPWRRLAMIGDNVRTIWHLIIFPHFIGVSTPSSLPNWNPNNQSTLSWRSINFLFFIWVNNKKWTLKRFQGNCRRSFTFCPCRWSAATGEEEDGIVLFSFGRTHCVTAKRISIYRRRRLVAAAAGRPTKGITNTHGGGKKTRVIYPFRRLCV